MISRDPVTARYKAHGILPPYSMRSNPLSSLDNSRSYYHLTKEKEKKRKSAAAGIAYGREGGKGGAKERRLRRLKEKVTSHFSP